jgi:hypothetical protein
MMLKNSTRIFDTLSMDIPEVNLAFVGRSTIFRTTKMLRTKKRKVNSRLPFFSSSNQDLIFFAQ